MPIPNQSQKSAFFIKIILCIYLIHIHIQFCILFYTIQSHYLSQLFAQLPLVIIFLMMHNLSMILFLHLMNSLSYLPILKITSKLLKLSLTQLTNLSLLNPINPLAKIKHARSVSRNDASFVWFLFNNIIKHPSFCNDIKC